MPEDNKKYAYIIEDVVSNGKKDKKIYAKKGEKVEIVGFNDPVYFLQGKHEKFPCTASKIHLL